tara:strand:+ start:9013 stop:13143 length:4131 start_codon:yes stop_codon:yes gene_type:complete
MTILRPDKQRVLNYALSQLDVQDQAPDPAGLEVDGRNTAELLSFGSRYGALINFYDLSNMPFGDWSIFFRSDPAVASAMHGALDIPEIRAELRRQLAIVRAQETEEEHGRHSQKIYHVAIRLLVVIDENVRTGEEDIDVHLTLAFSCIEREHIRDPIDQLRRHRKKRRDDRDWRLRELELLENLILTLLDELEAGAPAALKVVESALQQEGHAPQAALWNAFIMLYRKSRGRLNNFPRRLLDFYYGTLLQQSHRDAVPAETYLTFELAKNTPLASIPKGTRFTAGTDSDGATIFYESGLALEVVPAAVYSVSVHRVPVDEDGQADGAIGFLIGTLPGSASGQGTSFPAFGGAAAGAYGTMEMTPAYVGFVISNQALMLVGGRRKVKVTLSSKFKKMLPADLAITAPVEREVTATGDHKSGEWFSLLYSTAGGWVEVQKMHTLALRVSPLNVEWFEFDFELPPEAPPLVACSTKALPGALKPDWPTDTYPGVPDEPTIIMKLVNQPNLDRLGSPTDKQLSVAQYKILSEIKVTEISFGITVDGLPPAKSSSSGGLIDPSQNFAVFGLAPLQGAHFSLSVPELFVKAPSEIRLTIEWVGLPTNSLGFTGWYKDYVINDDGTRVPQGLFHNDSFKGTFGLTGSGLWNIANDPEVFLFQTQTAGDSSAGAGPAPSGVLQDFSELKFSCHRETSPPAYFNPTASELRLTLTEPKYGFGASIYSRNLVAASAANAAALRDKPPHQGTDKPKEKIAKLQQVNSAAKTGSYHKTMGSAVQSTLAFLNSEALAALHAAIPATGLMGDQKYDLVHSLEAAAAHDIENVTGKIWHRISRRDGAAVDHVDVTHDLWAWLKSFAGMIEGHGPNPLHECGAEILTRAENIATSWEAAKLQPAEAARVTMAAKLNSASAPLPLSATAILPNPPWLPMASSVKIHYTAHARLLAPNAAQMEDIASPFTTELSAANPVVVPGQRSFAHLNLFNEVIRAWINTDRGCTDPPVPLLPPVNGKAALYIELTEPVSVITLLFILEAGPEGWSTGKSELRWEMKIGDKWTRAAVMSDSTHGLNNSGVVALQIAYNREDSDDSHMSKHLRVLVHKGSINSAYIKSVTTNAVSVVWVPSAGAKDLGVNMPAGTISQSEQPLAGIAKIDQPMESFGGVPPLIGRSFDQWMAERLHHKGFAITGDDYAKIGLSAVPSLWQLAVIPAARNASGETSPGHVWLAAVAGKDAPNISDPTVPDVDPTTLNEIGEIVAAVASPFLQCCVTNPPWVRITVNAELEFSAANTTAAWVAILQEELILWLSPWIPAEKFGTRPQDYWTRQAIAEFIRKRPYVEGISKLSLEYDQDIYSGEWHYFTSALKHKLKSPHAYADASAKRQGRRWQ